jgi:hypothetical protein
LQIADCRLQIDEIARIFRRPSFRPQGISGLRRAVIVRAIFVGVLLCGAAAGAQVIDRVLATVDGRLVTLPDVRAATTLGFTPAAAGTSARDAALDRWIERLLVRQEVDRFAPPEPAAAVIDARVAAVLAPLGTPDQARVTLTRLGIDEAWVRQWVRDDLRIQAYTEQRFAGALEPTSEELESYYREHAGEFVRDGRELSADQAQALARDHVMAARRRVLVADWLDGLRRRATIVRPGPRNRP